MEHNKNIFGFMCVHAYVNIYFYLTFFGSFVLLS